MADELPMVWTCGVWFYLLVQLKKPKNGLSTPLAIFITVYITIVSLIHIYSAFVIVFQLHFVLLLTGGIILTIKYKIFEPMPDTSDSMLDTWAYALVIAATCWAREFTY